MTREEFLENLSNNLFTDEIMPIFDFFESHLYDDKLSNLDSFISIIDSLNRVDIKKSISFLRKKLFNNIRGLLLTYCVSLFQNVQQFEKMRNTADVDKLKQKWKKVLLSYINLSRLIVDDNKIQRSLLQQDNSIKIILCLGTIQIENDDVRVNKEIANIQEIINQSPNDTYLVIPIHGCSFQQFEKQIQRYNITHIHIAGHSSEEKIEFSDNGVTYKRFLNHIKKLDRHFELLFLNCCFTYEYLDMQPFPYSDKTICHETELNGTTAYDASDIFYTHLFQGSQIDGAWTMVQNSIEDNLYHVLHP